MRTAYLDTLDALRERRVSTHDVTSRVRLTKSAAEYLETRESRRELPYEAMLETGHSTWSVGERVRVYRGRGGTSRLYTDAMADEADDPRDYDVPHYQRILRDTFARRLERAFRAEDFASIIADPDQLTLFDASIASIQPILRQAETPIIDGGQRSPPTEPYSPA